MSFILKSNDQAVFEISAIWIIIIIAVCASLIFFIYTQLLKNKLSHYKIDTVTITSGGISTTIKKQYEVQQIAYSLWVELQTRKIGIPIDEENDVIYEVYKSWYTFFSTAREMIKAIPADELKSNAAKDLVILTTNILNKEIRAHLTKWQAKYRYWYKKEKDKDSSKHTAPQHMQKNFNLSESENYKSLMEDMISTNEAIINYRKQLEVMVFGNIITDENNKIK